MKDTKVLTPPRPRGRPRAMHGPCSTVTTWIPTDLRLRLQIWSEETGRSISDLCREVIINELNLIGDEILSHVYVHKKHTYSGGLPPLRVRRMQSAHEGRARRLGLQWDSVDLRRVYEHWKGVCGICGHPVGFDEFTVDHIVPVSRQGPHVFDNLQPAHSSCNSSKGDRIRVPS